MCACEISIYVHGFYALVLNCTWSTYTVLEAWAPAAYMHSTPLHTKEWLSVGMATSIQSSTGLSSVEWTGGHGQSVDKYKWSKVKLSVNFSRIWPPREVSLRKTHSQRINKCVPYLKILWVPPLLEALIHKSFLVAGVHFTLWKMLELTQVLTLAF